MFSFRLLVALSGILVVNGQIISDGQCDTSVQPMQDFELDEYLGQWYEISRTPNNFQSGQCAWAEYSYNEETSQVEVYNRIVNENFYSSIRGTVRLATPGTGHLIVEFPTDNGESTEANYWVLDSWYESYSLVYSCVNINEEQRAINVWKLSRTTTMNTNTHVYLDNIIDGMQGVASGNLVETDHSDDACFLLPELEDGAPVVLAGQCGTHGAPVMEDFDLARFIGVWHDIASYSNDFQAGTCNSGRYTLTADGADLVSYHVEDLALSSATGSVRRASEDSSGRLVIGFPGVESGGNLYKGVIIVQEGGAKARFIAGGATSKKLVSYGDIINTYISLTLNPDNREVEERDYWIIGTDYANYALAYSCSNVDEEQMRVFSWKLSRGRSLSAESTAAINAMTDNIIILNDRYYDHIDQTEDGCFYLPVSVPGQPVVFPGTCDVNIPVVEDFNLNRYSGLWHDIESYDASFQGGTCNNAQYSINDLGTVDVLNTQVVSQRLDSITGVARPASDDNSARLIVSFDVAGQTVESDYFVLATDYDNYALVYSCRDIEGDLPYREVYSWKLSRAKQMSVEHHAEINSVVDEVPVLNARYYQGRDQTDNGCFYFPWAQPGLPVVFPGQCVEDVSVVSDFNVERYLGLWHDIASYPSVNQQGSCKNALYSSTDDDHVDVLNTQVSEGFLESITGRATLDSTDGSAKLTVTFNVPGAPEPVSSPYWVLATDYDNYALVYSCVNVNPEQRAVWSWKLGRAKALTSEHLEAIDEAISAVQVLDAQYYENTDQSDEGCFFLPDLEPGVPVIITGQCDPDIAVMQNFNPVRYAGQWHDVASYYDEFQDGTCNDAYYTLLPDDTVGVYNTQVNDQTLDSINGTARLTTTDGSGKLEVTFPISGSNEFVTSDYFVLDTDYDSYSLVYSCRNEDNNNRRVWSWKLSRTRHLPEDASNAIDAIINTVPVLTNAFYVMRDHSDDACFYYPVPNGQPVVFRGLCDDSIPAVPDFNAERYSGRWFNIEKYPSIFQDGTCNTVRYTLGEDGVLNQINTQVISEELITIEGVARFAVDDNSGRFIVSFPIPGSEDEYTETDFWVLTTDYDEYALVYTCRNIPDDHRREVLSWKLSRTKELTPDASSAITAVMNNIPVLDQRYFETTNQSDEGCFFYPEHVQDQPVVFPGPCDPNVPVVENFDVERYQGLWHEVASYPSVSQLGTCNNARYTLNGGQVDVFNSMVNREQRLETISGTASQVGEDGKLEVNLNIPGSDEPVAAPYWVLDTDYETFSLVYSCVNINAEQRAVWSWKLSREKEIQPEANERIDAVIASVQVLDERYYQTTAQSDEACFYLPFLEPGEPVTFIGQCDQNIPVVEDFDAYRYQGQWNDIEAYSAAFQDGTCNNADYSLNEDGTLDVYRTQVINQLLDAVSGNAVPITNGKFQITYPGSDGDITAEYWILDTDYDNYSFGYSCLNLDSETRRVWSWKLSRTRELTAEGSAAIDTVIATIPVLNQEYYTAKDQSDDGCFYYPEPDGRPVVFRGQCDETIPSVADFNAERYSGRWFDIEKYPSIFQDGTCNTARYTLGEDGVVNVVNTQVNSQELNTIEGVARIVAEDNSGRLIVTFPIAGSEGEYTETDYWVLATDYDVYALVYTCRNIPDDHRREVWSWKLSRTKELTPDASSAITEVVNTIPVLDQRYFEPTDQSDEGCFFYPEHIQDQPVVFSGQCDPNVPVVENFDVGRYQGLWHEVASYPSVSQLGTCNNARYTLNGGQVDVFNSMVNREQRLETISGTASQVGEDGKLEVNLNVPGSDEPVAAPYWVLDTDYDTFSLVYSCVNINAEQRAVWSWKLSREKEIQPEANERIDAVIASVQVLDERYYQTTDQSDEACFYLPFLEPGEPVDFFGQCDLNIPAQPDFDPVRYQGLWHEIESYPSIFQGGTCNNARYDVNTDGTVAVHNTQVVEERLDTIDGVARLASDDNSGKLIVEFPVPGSDDPVTSDYWVLSTDYDNYALVYTCADRVDADGLPRRQVWSWKLSRSKQLSEDSHAEMNQVIDTIDVLNDEYYAARDQTDQGCFFFPVHVPGQTVVFPGQCDQSIQVVQGFDVERYTGPWYDIESYPQQFQAGATCATAEYTLNDDGTVQVDNHQVMSLRPETITGVARLDNDVGDAKLIVSFPIAGSDLTTESPYWVLSTDYENYALVYSCSNLDDDRRTVTSWKLSREPTLSPDSRAAIDAAMEAVQVLKDKYFDPRGHTEDDCFYYPYNDGGPVLLYGQCEDDANVPAVEEFNVAGYLGNWYEASRFPNEFQTGQCAQTNFMLGAGGLDVVETIVHEDYQHTQEGFAYISDDGRGALSINFPGIGGEPNPDNNYYILGTDNTNYALVYGCRNVDDNNKQVYSWKLSRSRTGLTPADNERIDELVTSNIDLFEDYYEETSQGDDACFHYPEFNEPEEIVLPGPCNDTIAPMPGFEWNRYQGRWFEAARYPQEHQVGQCARIEFSEDGSVLNTIVLGDDLNSVIGTSVLGNDGRITVTYSDGNGGSRQEIHYVLTTDYNNYALVYSCNNLNNGASRQVTSWKLSRQPSWNTAYDAAIAPFIQNTQGLLEDYFQSSDQSDEACFYIPEVDEESDVVFRGQCEEVQGVANFDMQRYLGWWHELQHYPSGFDTGDCLSSRYQVVNGQYSSVNTSVNGLEATVTNNNLVLSNAAPGRLTKTLDNGETVDIWVLDTDYETYSLLYSCQNNDNGEHRKVWSAIHSRDRELTVDPEEIANIDSIQTLDPRFYVDVDQSDEACFHYPDLAPGEQVILPGQCNEQISVVPSFDAASYTGIWFQVERYPQESETGTCAASSVALNVDSGEISVTNSQVFDGERARRTGTAVVAADGSGRVTVTFPVEGAEVEEGEEIPTTSTLLHILGTDYTSYALVYTCTNYGRFQRSVGAWKMSREPELSSSAQAAINALIQTHPELHQQYFVSAPQEEECPSVGAALLLKATAILVTLLASLLYLL